MGRKARVVAYARFSCDKQRDASIEDQLYAINQYCEARGQRIVAQYCDYALSGRSDDRPEFLRMIEDAKGGSFSAIVVWKMDRFARNIEEQYYYEHVLRGYGVHFESTRENIAGGGIEATSTKALNALFAELRSRQGAEDTMRGMEGKARRCQYLGYQWFGYSHEGDEITLDPVTAPVVRKMHEDFLSGSSLSAIARGLDERGIRTSRGTHPTYDFVDKILRAERYCGVYTWGKVKDENGRVVKGPDGKPLPLVRVEDGIPAIVSREVKDACLKRLSNKRMKNDAADFALSGRLWCSECGQPMHGETYGHDHLWYSRYVCRHRRKPCVKPSDQKLVEGSIARALRALMSDRSFCERLADEHVRWQESQDQGRASIKAAEKELRSLDRQRQNLVRAVEDGMPWELVRDRIAVLEDTKEGVERRIEELRARRCEISRADIMKFFSAAAGGFLSDEDLIDLFVSKAWLYDGKVGLVLNVAASDTSQDEFETATAQQMSLNAQVDGAVREFGLWCPTDGSSLTPNTAVYLLERGFGIVLELAA